MWFSPLKGAHLTLGQLDKTLPVDISVEANQKIERGSFVYIKALEGSNAIDPRFALYTATEAAKPNAVPYIALMSVKDFQAGMAGKGDQAPIAKGIDYAKEKASSEGLTFLNVTSTPGEQKFNGPRITAISVLQPAEYQTTAFDSTKSYYVGAPLTIDNGILTPFTSGTNIVGYVTAVPKSRWINDLGASLDGARISGGNKKVLEFSTAWIPVASTGTVKITQDTDKTITDKGTTPGALNVGAPKVEKAK